MRPGAFLTHGLLSLVSNVVSDISLSPTTSLHSTWDYVASPRQSGTQDLTPTYHIQITKFQLRKHGACVVSWELLQAFTGQR